MAYQKKCRNIQSMQQARMNHACCISLDCGCAFCSNLQPFTYRQLKQYQETKINKTRLFPHYPPPPLPLSSLIGFTHKVHSIRIEK